MIDPRKRTRTAWANIRALCTNSRHPGWKYVGGKGVELHKPWADSFEIFLKDVGLAPERPRLRRIDPSLGYLPGNVVWEQHSKRRAITPTR